MIRIKIPATTANMGPGFDTLGMALKLYNIIEFEETSGETHIFSNGKPVEGDFRENLIYISLSKTLDKYGFNYNGFNINVSKCDIPISRGLGSSAACIVGGIEAANRLLNKKLSQDDVINIATEIEGHPDNVVPAVVGGMAVSIKEGDIVNYSKVSIPSSLKFAVMVPSFEVSTSASRKILPKAYQKEDCVFNISRSAMLIAALYNGEFDKLRYSFDDKIHQPYRKELIRNSEKIFTKAKESGSVGEFISGSGSTLIAVINKNENYFLNEMKKFLKSIEDNWTIRIIEPDLQGVSIA